MRRSTTTYIEVEVDIEEILDGLTDKELEDLKYHSNEDCDRPQPGAREDVLYGVLGELHRQAHPDEPHGVDVCRRDPCRGLSLRDFPGLGGAA